MSLSLPKRLNVLIGPRGAMIMGGKEQALSNNEPGSDELGLAQSFDRLLAATTIRQVRLFISPALIDHLVLPGLEHWLKNDDLIALARSRLASFYGTNQNEREVVVARGGYGIPGVAASISMGLLTHLQDVAKARSVKLIGVFPLAALAMNILAHEGKSPVRTAIWLEDQDAFWVAFCDNAHWISMRSIPANTLRHATRPDILQREHLSAGLPTVNRICFGALRNDIQVPDEWRPSATEYTDHINGSDAQPSILNFLNERRNRTTGFLLVAALIVLIATLHIWNDRQSRHAEALAVLTETKTIADKANKEERRMLDSSENDYRRAMSAYSHQMAPWGGLFSVLNESAGSAIGLTTLSADALDGSLALEGEAKRFDDIQAFADKLSENPMFRDGKITSMLPGGEASAGRVRFGFGIHWASDILGMEAVKP